MKPFEAYLKSSLASIKDSKVKEAMEYSLLYGGKRIRPQLLFTVLQGYGIEEQVGYKAAAGIEMLHTYSLIHDDLPAMDNDTLRRGRATCHIAFDEAAAILAGDALLTQAFIEASSASEDMLINHKITKAFGEYAGANGMILGQIKDLEAEKMIKNWQEIQDMHLHKTGKLIVLPLICAAYLANKDEDIEILSKLGYTIGLLFQVQDDILDVTASSEQLGKDAQSDIENDKATSVSILGIDKAQELVISLYEEALALLAQLSFDTQAFAIFLTQLKDRTC
ncbi:MAG: polyprenyl synthetase family protein [Erysipelotrichaceae bacterium]|nr:polyprenyl synthetase family protein [Erysipelotrichaceae bacterium]